MNRRNFLGGALLSIPLFSLKWPRLKSDVPNIRVGDFGAYRCTIHDAYTGKDFGYDGCFTFVDCENGIVERLEKHPVPAPKGPRPRVMEHRWVIVRLHPEDK
jgi:hypothetical protein